MPPTLNSRQVPLNIAAARAMWTASLLFFVDLSKWNPVEDYKALASNIDAAIIKITGVTGDLKLHTDALAPTHIKHLRAWGVPLGAYHYAKFVGEDSRNFAPPPEVQAAYFAEAARAHGGFNVLALDLEPGELKAAIKAGMTPAQIEDWTRRFMSTLDTLAAGAVPAVYMSGACIDAADGGIDWLKDSGLLLWWAGYPRPPFAWPSSGPAQPLGFKQGWPQHDWAWQYAGGDDDRTPLTDEGGKAPGIKGDVDCNCTPRQGAFAAALTRGRNVTFNPGAAVLFGGLAALCGWGVKRLFKRGRK